MAQSGVGDYGGVVGVGTAHSRFITASELARDATTVTTATPPASYGAVLSDTVGDVASTPGLLAYSATGASPGASFIYVPLGLKRDLVQIAFLGALWNGSAYSTANNATFDAFIWLKKEWFGQNADPEYIYEYVGKVSVTIGDQALTSTKISRSGFRLADQIAVDEDASLDPGIRVTGQNASVGAKSAFLNLDTKGAVGVYILPTDGSDGTLYVAALAAQV